MNLIKNSHLSEDQLIRAVVDPGDLTAVASDHLTACPKCRQALHRFEEELSTLGKLAGHYSPEPKRNITLPVVKPVRSIFRSWKWRIALSAAFSAALIIVVVWWSGMTHTASKMNSGGLSEELWEDEQMMTEISMLSENALPPLYMDIAGEPDPGTTEDFMEFIDPMQENNSLSKKTGNKGALS